MALLGVIFVVCFSLVKSQTPLNLAGDCCETNAENIQAALQRLTSLEKAVATLKAENVNLRQNSSALLAMQQELAELKCKYLQQNNYLSFLCLRCVNLQSYWDVTITGEGPKIWAYARRILP
jgi:hypothetical protein